MHTTLIYAGFILSAYIIDLCGFRFFWDTLYKAVNVTPDRPRVSHRIAIKNRIRKDAKLPTRFFCYGKFRPYFKTKNRIIFTFSAIRYTWQHLRVTNPILNFHWPIQTVIMTAKLGQLCSAMPASCFHTISIFSNFHSCLYNYIYAHLMLFTDLPIRDVTKTLIGGGVYSYIHVLPDRFLFKLKNLNLI